MVSSLLQYVKHSFAPITRALSSVPEGGAEEGNDSENIGNAQKKVHAASLVIPFKRK